MSTKKLQHFVSRLALYYHTVKYLKLRQIAYRVYYKVKEIKINQVPPKYLEIRRGADFVLPILKNKKYIENDSVCFLNKSEIYNSKLWNDTSKDMLWLYNLHYFDFINTTSGEQNTVGVSYIQKWINDNPPIAGCGWDPYPISLRVINWIKYVFLGGELSDNAKESLYLQLRTLRNKIEHHILGNHIFENYKALCVGGMFFQGKEAESWFKIGFNGLIKEIKEQILADGGHFELSPMYQGIILEGMLDLYNFFRSYNKDFPQEWKKAIENMLVWLEVMCHPDGDISFFNDATFGVAPKLNELQEYASRLGIKNIAYKAFEDLVHLKDSGYIRVKLGDLYMIIDAGKVGPDYQPGHAHADTLSYEISYKGKRVVVNSGIDRYGSSKERIRQRGTAAHNCMVVDGKDSSEVWGGFRVGRRAEAKVIRIDERVIDVIVYH